MGTFKRKLLIFAQKKWGIDGFLHVFDCAAGLGKIVFVKLYGFLYSSWENGIFDRKEPRRGKKIAKKITAFAVFAKAIRRKRQKTFGKTTIRIFVFGKCKSSWAKWSGQTNAVSHWLQ